MAKSVLVDEISVAFFAPQRLPPSELDAIQETLSRKSFCAEIRRAIRALGRRYPALHGVRIVVRC